MATALTTEDLEPGFRQSMRSRVVSAFIAGRTIGAVAGALAGAGSGGRSGALIGAALGGTGFAGGEALTTARRRIGTPKPAAWRVAGAVLMVGAFGGAVELATGRVEPLLFAPPLGLGVGLVGTVALLSFRTNRLALGLASGTAVALVARFTSVGPDGAPLALQAASTVLLNRLAGAAWFRGADIGKVLGERVAAHEVEYVVPFEARTGRVGADYFRELARDEGGDFRRNTPGVGIIESFEDLRGPHFDPSRVHPLIREFYEHTSDFTLAIDPHWRRLTLPPFWLFKRPLARRLEQANLPFSQEEAQTGVVSYIDTIDFGEGPIPGLRGWVRAFKESGGAIYVGVYTVLRAGEVGYVSVGFPLPSSNFTATLLPQNHRGDRFLLRSDGTDLPYPGHYLTAVEPDGALTVVKVPSFGEQIEVYVEDGRLKTDHRFSLGGLNFLTLEYTIARVG